MMTRIALVLALSVTGANAGAAGDLAVIQARGQLIVSVKNVGARAAPEHKDPAHFEKRGMEIALAHAIAKHIFGDPERVSFKMMRKPERLGAVARGEVDLGISMLRVTPAAAAQVDFSTPYYESGVAVLEAADGALQSKRDLAGRSLALIEQNDGGAAALLTAVAEANAPAPKIILFSNFDEGARAITDHRVDGLLSEAANIDVFLAHHPGPLKRSPLLTADRFAVAVAKGNRELLAAVNAVIEELTRSGELTAMADQAELPSATPR